MDAWGKASAVGSTDATAMALRSSPGRPMPAGENRFDVVVVGAGVVGLATAYQVLCARPGSRVAVLDKEDHVAGHQSGHNSGVIHSGINYVPGSLKARLCREGADELKGFAAEHGVPMTRTGKLIVAVEPEELQRLSFYRERGVANGLRGLRMLGAAELREREPHLLGLGALEVPETAVIDFAAVSRSYADRVRAMGGQVVLGCEVSGYDRSRRVVSTSSGLFRADVVVFCAGTQSDRLARVAGDRPGVRIVPFRGRYHALSARAQALLGSTVYPVPDPRLPFLGVHFTRRHDGTMWAGPNALLVMSREGYLHGRRVDVRDAWDSLSYPGLWRLGRQYWREGVGEFRRDLSSKAMLRELRRYLPDLVAEDLRPVPEGTGIRAQALRADGTLVDDFLIHETPGAVFVLNAPSPAATASLAIGRVLAAQVTDRLAA